jgi:glucose/arabinose dehydrogenase
MKFALLPLCIFPLATAAAQFNIGLGAANQLFQKNCASCHGSAWEGGKGGSLLRDHWKYFTDNEEQGLARIIRKGVPELGMQPFAGTLSEAEIRSLVIFIEERRQIDRETRARQSPPTEDQTYKAGPYAFKLETILQSPNEIWALAFLPDGRMLYTEKQGELHLLDPAHPETNQRIEGTPVVWNFGLGGLLNVVVHPDYAKNGWIYLTYTESSTGADGRSKGTLAVVRGRIRDGKWVDQQDLFHLPEKYFSTSGDHVGCRLVIRDGFIFFSIGDRGAKETAQDLAIPSGKIFRLTEDGKIPKDNPFPKGEGMLAAIWSYGHRNPQGLAFQPGTDVLWESEHGPRGGDEINVIEAGKNYGWPVISYGMNDNGTPLTYETAREGMEQPKHYWTPSIAVCAIAFYEGDKFPSWRGNLFAGGLYSEELHRLTLKDKDVIGDKVVLRGAGRIRDVVNGPDGTLYLVLNSRRGDANRIVRMVAEQP